MRARLVIVAAAAALLASVATPIAQGTPRPAGPVVTTLATFGTGNASGSTVGPDGALYVTDPNAGSVLRVDRRTGAVSTYADGLPPAAGLGGAMDVAFLGHRAYVLVTLVGGDIVGGAHIGDKTVGIYRLGRDGHFRVFADIGSWSVANPPETDYFVTTGVQYALQPYGHGFLVTDGHHNRVLRVNRHGDIREFMTFGNIVPTGLETVGRTVLMAQAGPVPHFPEAGRVVAFGPRSHTAHKVANGASMLVDVERGRGGLYALSQGQWDGVMEGSPALPNTGRLVKVGRHGTLVPVVDRQRNELKLDRPTSLELIGNTAYVVGLNGTIVKIANLR